MSAAYAGDIRSREAWAAEGHLAELTSVRFFAAAAVLLGHFQDMLGMPDTVAALVGGGQYVSLFFALSGFILTYRYWDTFSGGVERGALRRFLVARFARIYPSYVLALVALTIVYAVESHDHPGSILYPGNLVVSWLVNLFALQTFARSVPTQQYWNSPSWSVSTELCFYLMFPLLVLWIARHCRTRAALLGLLAASVALSAALYAATLVLVFDHGWQRELWLDLVATRNVFWRTHQFVIGVVGARLLYGGHLPWLSRPAARNALLVASLALVTAMNLAPWPADDHAIMILRPYRLEIAYLFPFAGIIVALAAGRTFLSRIMEAPLLVLLGHASYALYIFHWIPWVIILHTPEGLDPNPLWVAFAILATAIFSVVCYLCYEKPVRRFLRRKLDP